MSRQLFIPWLRQQIDSQMFPGVRWTNPEKTEFCIPWKHALRHDSTDTDVLVFKAWAEVSGNGQAHGDHSTWKRNFRSVLRVKGFKVKDDSKNVDVNPHKVYRWPTDSTQSVNSSPASNNGAEPVVFGEYPLPVQETHHVEDYSELFLPQQETVYEPDILQLSLQGLDLGPPTGSPDDSERLAEQQQLQNHSVIGAQASPQQPQFPLTFQDAISEDVLPGQPAIGGAVGGPGDRQRGMQISDTCKETISGDQFKTQFQIIVLYKGKKVFEQLVENEAGFCLVYRPEQRGPEVDPESGLTRVSLPSPGAMFDQKQAHMTQNILDKLGVGLEIRLLNNVICGRRRGETKAFWSLSKSDPSRQPQEVSKHGQQPLYHIREFIERLKGFIDREGECYPCSLFLCLGEKWPDPDNRGWFKKLVTVEVVFTSMELLKNLALECGASSLKSMELQLSLDEMMEIL